MLCCAEILVEVEQYSTKVYFFVNFFNWFCKTKMIMNNRKIDSFFKRKERDDENLTFMSEPQRIPEN